MSLTRSLNFSYKVLLLLELLKLTELFVVFAVKENSAIWTASTAIIFVFVAASRFRILGLSLVLMSNYILIFSFGIVSQHFAFLTFLLTIFSIRFVMQKTSISEEEIDKVVALLLVFQLSILYFFAALWKINSDYFTGMQMLQHLRGFLIYPNLEQPSFPYLLLLSSFGVLAELILSFQFFFRTKYLVFAQSFGFVFHVLLIVMIGQDLRTSFQILIFSCSALAIYPLCNRKKWNSAGNIVFWDASCSFCGKSVNIFKKIDVTTNMRYISNVEVANFADLPFDSKIIEETIVVWDQVADRYWTKSKAIIYILTDNYFFWWAKPIIHLPLIFKYSDKLYDRVAMRRSCHI
jgi:predicted DCC family thiol-disulfide oxidoreductase YuxK